jgi:hypothetical protein
VHEEKLLKLKPLWDFVSFVVYVLSGHRETQLLLPADVRLLTTTRDAHKIRMAVYSVL